MKKRVVSLLLCLIMALSLIPTAAFAAETGNVDEATTTVETGDAVVLSSPGGSDWNHGGGQQEKQNTVDHIDIQMALNIPGKTNVTLNENDISNLIITAQQGSTNITNFKINNRILNGSTDGSNNKQARLSGSFPIGTENDPVEYTITLTKTVNGRLIR